ncbi:MAG: hypothetical protein AB1921_01075 [Thermodesulfobacteriota bacterium]
MKARLLFAVFFVFCAACAHVPVPAPALDSSKSCETCPPCPASTASLASAFAAYTEEVLAGVLENLRLMAEDPRVQTGDFAAAKPLLSGFQARNPFLTFFYCLPDGSCYQTETGLTGKNLSDRAYFRKLLEGKEVFCRLVVGRVTGLPTAVIAVPVMKDGKVVAELLASVSLPALNAMAANALALPEDMFFFALAPGGTTTLCDLPEYIFEDPRRLPNASLRAAMDNLLSHDEGEVCYVLAGFFRKVRFLTGKKTGWRYVVGVKEAAAH